AEVFNPIGNNFAFHSYDGESWEYSGDIYESQLIKIIEGESTFWKLIDYENNYKTFDESGRLIEIWDKNTGIIEVVYRSPEAEESTYVDFYNAGNILFSYEVINNDIVKVLDVNGDAIVSYS